VVPIVAETLLYGVGGRNLRAWSAKGESVRRAPAPAGLALSCERVSATLIVLVIASFALWMQLSTYPNHDVAWILWGTREMLRGATFGRDIIEPNPPLAWYLSMPTTALAMWFHLPLDWTFRGAVAVAGACSAASLAWLAPRQRSFAGAIGLCAIAAVSLLLLPGREFGQREHLFAIATLPYLALAARWIDGSPSSRPVIRFLVGAFAGLGIALKPYFLVTPLAVELGLFIFSSRRPALVRAENLAIAVVCAIYAAWVVCFEKPYILEAAPLANEIYWSFNRPIARINPPLILQLLVAAPPAIVAMQKRDAFGIISAFAWCGFATSYVIQHKGYGYHLLPVVIATFLLIGCVLTNVAVSRAVKIVAAGLAVIFSWPSFAPVVGWWQINRPGGQRAVEIERLLASIDHHATNGRFLAIAVHPYPSFPAAIYSSARYTARTNSQWFLPAVVQIRGHETSEYDASSIEQDAREFILHDLREKPDIVLIDTDSARHTVGSSKFDFLSFYREDAAFRALWSNYREIEPIDRYRQFVLVKGDATTKPSGAAQ